MLLYKLAAVAFVAAVLSLALKKEQRLLLFWFRSAPQQEFWPQ